MGWAFSVFAWAYALFEIPGGWLGDRMGARRVLMRIVVWWSFFTAATGWAWNTTSLIVTRTLFGAGEAGAYPNMTRMFATWLPHRERERAQAVLWLASRWGGAFTPLLVAYILQFMTWRRAFELFGVARHPLGGGVLPWYRDDPGTHPSVNAAELALMPPPHERQPVEGGIPWQLLMSKPAVLLLCAQYFCLGYGWWFYVTWLPTYLREARGTSVQMGALLAGLPLLLGGDRVPDLGGADPAHRPCHRQRRAGPPDHRGDRLRRRVSSASSCSPGSRIRSRRCWCWAWPGCSTTS